jgi:HEAT repeat protein
MIRSAAIAAVLAVTFTLQASEMPADVAKEVAKFKDASPQVRQQAVAAVGRFGEKAKPALPELCKMLEDKTTWVITKSLMAMKDIGPDEATCRAVMPILGLSNETEKRDLAADVFVAYGEASVPLLNEALKDELKAEGAIIVIERLGPKAKGTEDALKAVAANHKSRPVKARAAKALRLISK